MPLFLLLLGVLTTLAGLALVASGVTMRDTFDSDVITPGTIAAVGGLLLIGVGLTVREIQRLVQAVAGQPLLRDAWQGRITNAVESSHGAAGLPFPPKPSVSSDLPATPGPSAPVAEGASSALRRRETAQAEPSAGEFGEAPIISQAANGAAASRATPRLNAKPNRSAATNGARGPAFKGLWPGNRRTEVRSSAVQAAAVRPPPAVPVSASKDDSSNAVSLADEGFAREAQAPVSVLKSGIIEGMAYTLYSDGSIEAELPQGKLRFGSITALRQHIEGAA